MESEHSSFGSGTLMKSFADVSLTSGGVLGRLTNDREVVGRSARLRDVLDERADIRLPSSAREDNGTRKFKVGTFCMLSK
jgi:hypothetical protein